MKLAENKFVNARILVVDDTAENVRLVLRFLEFAGYLNIETHTNSAAAMTSMRANCPDIVLLDLNMPKPDGYEILAELRTGGSFGMAVPVLVFTADATPETRAKALEAGASDFLTKPGDAQEILLRVKNFLKLRQVHLKLQRSNSELEESVSQRTAALLRSRREALETLARAAEFRDDDTGDHTKRVGELSAMIGRKLGLQEDFIVALQLAAPLHDVGKIATPDSILLKPGGLDDEEIQVMRRHTLVGGQVFFGVESPLMILCREIALHHHERWDGTGYHSGLAGEGIPLAARIVAVADVYDALVHQRPYKPAWSHDDAVAEIAAQSGKQFDPEVAEAFLAAVGSKGLSRAA